MLIRISLILAIVLGLAATGLNFAKVKEKITTLQTNLKTETDAHKEFEDKYNRTKSELDRTNAVLRATQETLKATEEQRDKAVAEAAAQTKRADKLTEDLTKTRKERDDAQAELAAYRAAGMTPQQVAGATKERVSTEQRNVSIRRALVVLNIGGRTGGVTQIRNHRVEGSEKHSHVDCILSIGAISDFGHRKIEHSDTANRA